MAFIKMLHKSLKTGWEYISRQSKAVRLAAAFLTGVVSFLSLSAIGQFIFGSAACSAGKWFGFIPQWIPNWVCGLIETFF